MNIQQRAAFVLQQIDAALARIATTSEAREQEFLDAIIEIRGNGRTLNTEEMTRARIFYNAGAAASRTLLPVSLHCLKTAIEGLLVVFNANCTCEVLNPSMTMILSHSEANVALTTLCDQWEAKG